MKQTNPAEKDRVAMDSTKKRVRGIEPPSKAWEAFILPLNHTRKMARKLHVSLTTVKQQQHWSRCSRRFQLSGDQAFDEHRFDCI